MKNKLFLGLILISILITTSSCKKHPVEDKTVFTSADIQFKGDPDWHNLYYYDLYLYDSQLTNSNYSNGTMIYLAMNCIKTDHNEISSGNYTANSETTPQTYTFDRGTTNSSKVYGSYVGILKNGDIVSTDLIVSGQLQVNQNGNYELSGYVTTENGYTYDIDYRGGITVTDYVEPLPETLTHGEIWYQGDVYNNGLNLFTIKLGAKDVDVSGDGFSDGGDALQIEVYTPSNITANIPSGSYPISPAGNNTAYTALAGEYNETDNANYGTVYYTADALYINQGYVNITYNGYDSYNLKFSLTDDYYGYTAAYNFTLNLPLYDAMNVSKNVKSRISTPSKSSKVMRANAVKKPNARFDRYKTSNKTHISEIRER